MTTLTGPEIATLWVLNGGPLKYADTFAGIALSQSGGSTSAVYNTKYTNLPGYTPVLPNDSPEYSIGLWQINQVAHPQYSAAYLMNEMNQAKAALQVSNNGTDLGPWSGDPVADAAMANGGAANLSQINAALGTEGKTFGGGSGVLPLGIGGTGSSTTGSTSSCSGSFTLHRKGGCCSTVYAINASPFHLISECQADALLGGLIMVGGAVVMLAGIAVTLASVGLRGPVAAGVARVPGVGNVVGVAKGSRPRVPVRTQRRESAIRIQESESKASARRYGQAKPASRGFQPGPGDDQPL